MSKKDDGNDDVGYKKPPKKHQYKKGQSGNKEGRPKGVNDLKTDLREELSEKVTITEGGRTINLSKQRLAIKSLIAKACKGDVRATNSLIRFMLVLNITGLEENIDNERLTADEDTLLELLIARAHKPNVKAIGQSDAEGGDNERQ